MFDQSSRRKIAESADAFHSATTLDELSQSVVEAVRSNVGATGVAFLPMGPGIPLGAHAAFSNDAFSSEHMREVTLEMAPITERDLGGVAGLLQMPDKTLDLNEIFGPRGLDRTEMFNEHWRPYRLERMLTALFGSVSKPLGLLAVARSARDVSFQSRDVQCLEQLRQHIEAPLARLVRGDETRINTVPTAVAAGLPVSAALFDARCRLIWVSALAEQELGLRRNGSEWTPNPGSAELSVWRQLALDVIVRRKAVFSVDEVVAQRVEVTPGVPAVMITRKHQRRETLDERILRATRKYAFTPRESEVLLRLATGLSNKEIAANLGCGWRTVEVHVANILRKSGCSSRLELVAKL